MHNTNCFFFLLFLVTCFGQAQERVIEGVVKDKAQHGPLPYANVFLQHSGTGTATNTLGNFRLIVPRAYKGDSIVVSFIGFKTQVIPLDDKVGSQIIYLEEQATSLQEVVVKGYSARTLVDMAINKIPYNYRQKAYRSEGFYRVTSQKDREYIHLSEAVFDIYRSNQDNHEPQLSLEKMRAIKDEAASKGIDLGLKPSSVVEFDIVHHPGAFGLLDQKSLDRHEFRLDGTELVDGREAYKISFDQKRMKKSGLKGYLLIDKVTMAFVYLDFGLSDKGVKYHKFGDAPLRTMLKIAGIQIEMSRNNYQIHYKKLGNTYFLNRLGNDATLTFKSEREHYNFAADTRVDYLTTALETEQVEAFSKEEVLRQNRMIEQQYSTYDADFWKEHTIILPTSDFNEIAKKLEANNKANDLKQAMEEKLEELPKEVSLRTDSILSFFNQKDLFNGNALIVLEGEVLIHKSYNNQYTKNSKNSRFRIGSLSKSFTALLVAGLVADGKIQYSDSIKSFLPNYLHPNITISQLLSHQSGIENYLSEQEYLTSILTNSYSLQDLMDLYCSDPLVFDPGTKFEYSNSNYLILAAIIEKVSGREYREELSEKIFDPLGMNDSFYGNTADSTHLAIGYIYGKPEPNYDKENVIGAGGITSTARDLFIWSKALDSGSLLPKQQIREMWSPRVIYPDYEAFYGYGWLIDGYKFSVSKKHKVVYHPGTDFGFYTMFVKQPDSGITIILLNNTGDFPRFEITELLLNELN